MLPDSVTTSALWGLQWSLHSLVLLVAAASLGAVAVGVWWQRDVPGSTGFLLLIGSMMLWALTYALQIAGVTEATILFWANANHVAVALVPLAWIGFALQFTGRAHLLTPRTVGGLSVVPAVYVGLVWTNPRHGLIRDVVGVQSVTDGALVLLDQTFGPAFWAHAVYGYGLMLVGVLLFTQLFLRAPRVYRRQGGLLLLGALVPMATNLAFHLNLYTPSNFDLTSFSFVVTAVLFFAAIYSYRLLDLTPIARESVIDTLTEGIVVIDTKDRIIDINDAASEILAQSRSEAIGADIETVLPRDITNGDRPEFGAPEHTEVTCEIGQTTRTLAVTQTSVVDVNGTPIGRTVTLRDVTAKRALEQEVENRLAELLAVNNELDTFTTAISHDLRQPARTTERYIQRVRQSEPALSAESEEILAVAQTNAEQIQSMLSDLLAYSRIEHSDDEYERVSIAAVVERATTSLRFAIDETDARISVGELPTVSGVEYQLVRLFQNLISNAIRYSGSEPPVISIEGTSTETTHRLTVTDAGVGIDPDEIEYVFDMFTRGHHTDGVSGTGAGLAMCHKIVEQHGGSIDIESTPGHGTTVSVELPRRNYPVTS